MPFNLLSTKEIFANNLQIVYLQKCLDKIFQEFMGLNRIPLGNIP